MRLSWRIGAAPACSPGRASLPRAARASASSPAADDSAQSNPSTSGSREPATTQLHKQRQVRPHKQHAAFSISGAKGAQQKQPKQPGRPPNSRSLRAWEPPLELPQWTAPSTEERAWTSRIMHASSPEDLQRVITGIPDLNKFHLTAAFSRLSAFLARDRSSRGSRGSSSSESTSGISEEPSASSTRTRSSASASTSSPGPGPARMPRASPSVRPAALKVLPSLVGRARENLSRLPVRSLATIAHCVGTFDYKDKELMAELAKAAEGSLPEFTGQGLANLLWAFARLGVQPSERWMDAYLRACQARLGELRPQELSIVLWSLSRLQFRLQPGKLAAFLAAVRSGLAGYNAHSLSLVLWALATSGHQPEPEWLAAVAHEALCVPGKLRAASPQALSQLLWALAMLRHRPSEPVQAAVLHCLPAVLPRCNRVDLATLVYACAALRLPCDAALLAQMQRCTLQQLAAFQPGHIAKVCWAFAKLGPAAMPSQRWFYKMLTTAHQALDAYNVRDLSMLAWALAKLRVALPKPFVGRLLGRIEAMAADFPPGGQEVANCLWALAQLNVRPSPALLANFFGATENRLSTFKPMELSHMFWALADRRCIMEKAWLAEFLRVSFNRMPQFSPQGLSNIVWGLDRLGVAPPPAWLYSYVKLSRELMESGQLSALDLGTMICGLSSLNKQLQLQKVDEFLQEAASGLQELERSSAAYTSQQLQYYLGGYLAAPISGPEGRAASASSPAMAAASPSGLSAVLQVSELRLELGNGDGSTDGALPASSSRASPIT